MGSERTIGRRERPFVLASDDNIDKVRISQPLRAACTIIMASSHVSAFHHRQERLRCGTVTTSLRRGVQRSPTIPGHKCTVDSWPLSRVTFTCSVLAARCGIDFEDLHALTLLHQTSTSPAVRHRHRIPHFDVNLHDAIPQLFTFYQRHSDFDPTTPPPRWVVHRAPSRRRARRGTRRSRIN